MTSGDPSMTPWRLGHRWPKEALDAHLAALARRRPNFDTDPAAMTRTNGWIVDGLDAPLFSEPPGPPLPVGVFARARRALVDYAVSDPSIAAVSFDPQAPLLGRTVLLEAKAMVLSFLIGNRIGAVRDELDNRRAVFGYRIEALEGHVEQGFEWLLVIKDHQTGLVTFRIEAHCRPSDLPPWWIRAGFRLVGQVFRRLWMRRALARMRRLSRASRTGC